jgi:hypothetical protein
LSDIYEYIMNSQVAAISPNSDYENVEYFEGYYDTNSDGDDDPNSDGDDFYFD